MRLEGLGQWKNPVTLSGIEPATFRLVGVAQCLNQIRYRVPQIGQCLYGFVLRMCNGCTAMIRVAETHQLHQLHHKLKRFKDTSRNGKDHSETMTRETASQFALRYRPSGRQDLA
jgi:hypothetical protein